MAAMLDRTSGLYSYAGMIRHAAVIGDGAMGTVCAMLLAGNGAAVRLWGRDAERAAQINHQRENRRYLPGIRLGERIEAGADPVWPFEQAELVVAAIPCQHIRGVWQQVGPHVPPEIPAVSTAKGIEIDTLLRPSQILKETSAVREVAVLSGPTIAHEVARGLPASVVVACASRPVAARVQEGLSNEVFRVYTNDDLVGVELAAALKNVIALAAGVVDGLRLGDNAKAALLARGLAEITRLGVAMGARTETFAGLAGVGDLVTTCFSPHGRNRTAGERIGAGVPVQEVLGATPSVIEGIPTTRSVIMLARRHGVDMPITQAIGRVLFEGLAPAEAVRGLMTRQLRAE
jgi:glycerol-3-phosphate dehydrogenase (NAD(P)+)